MPSAMDIAAPVLDLGGSLITSAFNVQQQRENNRFQRDMSNTSHQREVDDLRKAGLNPILSANHGAATPPTQAPHVENPRIGEAINSAQRNSLERKQLEQQLALQNAQIRDTNAAAQLKEVEAYVAGQTKSTKVDQIREALYQMQMDFDNRQEKFPTELKLLLQQLEEKKAETEGKKLSNTSSAYGLSKDRSESQFYEGVGGDIEHWLKMLGISMPSINLFRGSRERGKKAKNLIEYNDSKGYNSFKDRYKGEADLFRKRKNLPLDLKPEFKKGGK